MAKGGEDAWFATIGPTNGGGAMYLADGVGGFNEQGVDPGLYARVLTYEAAKAFDAASRRTRSAPRSPVKLIQRGAGGRPSCPGASTMRPRRVRRHEDQRAANLGDSGFRVVRGGEVVFATPAQEHYFNCPYQLGYEPLSEDTDVAEDADEFEFTVKPGDLVVAGSDGLFDNVFDDEIAAGRHRRRRSSVAGAGALSAARAVRRGSSRRSARKHAEDPLFESPYAAGRGRGEGGRGRREAGAGRSGCSARSRRARRAR